MLTLLLANWRYVVMALLLAACAFYKWDAHRWEKKFYTFEAQVKVLGEAAKEKALAQEAADKLRRDTADAENATTVANLATTIKRLRDANPGSGKLPAAPSGSIRPDLACFDRAEYQRAYGEFVAEVRGLADEGSKSTVDLNTARKWAAEGAYQGHY